MSSNYTFKRTFYYDIEGKMNDFNIIFLFGAKKTGKTVCMKQIEEAHDNAVYYDLRTMDADDAIDLIDEIKSSIDNDESKIYLIDETSYWDLPEKAIAKIAHEYDITDNHHTKTIFAGGESVALEAWASRAFAGNAKFIYFDFLSYPEWLAYKNITEISAETYRQFIKGIREFYSFGSLDLYLKDCIEETIHSNYVTSNFVFNNSCDLLDVQILKNILYASLIQQTNNTEIFAEQISKYYLTDFETLKQGYIFLYKCGLITLVPISDETLNFENILDIPMELCLSDSNKIQSKNDLFCKVKICVKYPMFYAEIFKELFGYYPENDISDGMIECHVRGILPETYCYEYRGNFQVIDYVNFVKRKAIKISLGNNNEPDFDDLPPHFEKILLTQSENYTDKHNIIRILYYQFIFDNSN